MNELPEELVNIPIPLVGLVGVNSVHQFIEKNITTRSLIDFHRIHPVSPILQSQQQQPSVKTSIDLSSLDPFDQSNQQQQQQQQQGVAATNTNNTQVPELSINNQPQQTLSSTSSSPPIPSASFNPLIGGWRVQPLVIPMLKVTTLDAGSIAAKKEKRANHSESFVPAGILRANWIHKHTVSIPSVISLFLQWPDDKSPKAQELIMSQIDTVKANIKQRNIKLIVVVVTSTPNVDVSDERFNLVRRRADVDPKYFLFLNKLEMKGFVKKWEKLALELADLHYKEECQSSKSQISKSTHTFLLIRYHFKIAYYSEFRIDMNTALKYYAFAYHSLKDWKPNNDTKGIRFAELRTVASFLNFKICKLFLWSNNLNEAIQQFEKHIRLFKLYQGPDEKEFNHCAWLSREYQIFAELLDMCPNTNKALFSANPGFYYQTAAKYVDERRKYFKAVADRYRNTPSVVKFKESKQRHDLSILQYVGQPPPDVAHPLELVSKPAGKDEDESDDFYRLVAIELQANYTSAIIDLLSRAYEQANQHQNLRIISYVESLIANEYFYGSNQYELALKFYNKNAITYRREKWWVLLTYTLAMCLKCVHMLNLPTNYIGYAMDLLSPDLTNSKEQRSSIQQSLLYVLTNPTKLTPNIQLVSTLDVNMDHNHPLINCRVQFPNSIAFSHSKTEIFVVIESHFPNAIRFSRLRTIFSDSSYNKVINESKAITDPIESNLKMNEERKDLVFLPDESRIFSFTLNTREKAELECQTVILELGNGPTSINFRWNISEWAIKSDESEREIYNEVVDPPLPIQSSQQLAIKKDQIDPKTIVKPDPYKKFLERSSIRILDHESLIQIKCNHTPPAIINEFYQIELELINNDKEITSGSITFDFQQQQQAHNLIDKGIYSEPNKNNPLSRLELPHISERTSFKKKFYIYSSQIDEIKLVINVSYETKANEISHASKIFIFPVQIGFLTQFQFFNSNFQLNDMYDGNIVAKEPLLLLCDIKTNLPFNVNILRTTLEINNISQATLNPLSGEDADASAVPVAQLLSSSNQNLPTYELSKDNNYSCWFNLIPLITGESLSLGSLNIEWSRKSSSNNDNASSSPKITSSLPIQLPHMRIATNPFVTHVKVPASGTVGVPITHSISIYNNTNFLQEFDLLVINAPSFGGSDSPFLFSGDKNSTFSIHPESTHEIKHVLLPLVAGKHPLPHFKIASKRFNKELPKTKNPNEFLFIKPNIGLDQQ
ncbi:DUF1683 family protein [Heterostelium album PN500]|uniref:DUF1683 family protein n=1 Tax=Heterostelium pallidum (strain ATCC 26659 / Pp 5 / PN500) TaxID=670386 RepID=D3B3M0_HETP5|nr:DUF1683 family protein [Heterostelium album PN500]EFA83918.1 DUF1683 family protein [Heterostelium album PN500]|eukprot:XP_020436035.1 DUF1683 family protein [Heterostelium album PN500]